VLEQTDILNVVAASGVFAVLLTPWLSEPLIKACSNKLVPSDSPNTESITQPYVLKSRRRILRIFLYVLSILLSIALPIWAIVSSQFVPASNQYCMSTTVIGSIFVSTLGTNLIYLWLNACLARKVAYAPNK